MKGRTRRAVLAQLAAVAAMACGRGAAQEPDAADAIGADGLHVCRASDTLPDLAIRYGFGYGELAAANRGVDPWLPGEGTRIVLPGQHVLPRAPRAGLVINIGDQRLYHFPLAGPPQSFPIGIAADNDGIVLGATRIVRKRESPVWIPPASIRAERPDLPAAVGPGPGNPLGSFALDLGWPAMVVHGTNRPYGIGRRVSHGCFRLYEADIATLYAQVGLGTPVSVVYQPVKLGWRDNALLLEIHPSAEQMAELDEHGRFTPDDPVELPGLLQAAVGDDLKGRIAWDLVAEAAWRRTGQAVRIDRPPVLAPVSVR